MTFFVDRINSIHSITLGVTHAAFRATAAIRTHQAANNRRFIDGCTFGYTFPGNPVRAAG
jgi:hypothetical protein